MWSVKIPNKHSIKDVWDVFLMKLIINNNRYVLLPECHLDKNIVLVIISNQSAYATNRSFWRNKHFRANHFPIFCFIYHALHCKYIIIST